MATNRIPSIVTIVIASMLPALAQTSTTPADGWSGQVQCAIAVRGVGYQDDQTHTWVVSGPPIARNDFRDYPATWTVTGGGSRTPLSTRATAAGAGDTWTRTGSDASAEVRLFVPVLSNNLRLAAGQRTVKAIGGLRGTGGSMLADVDEWRFQFIDAPGGATQTSLRGSRAPQTRTDLVGWRQPPGATVTETCTWDLTKGTAASQSSSQGTVVTQPIVGSVGGGAIQQVDTNIGRGGIAADKMLSERAGALGPKVVTTPTVNLRPSLVVETTSPATEQRSTIGTPLNRLVAGGMATLWLRVSNVESGAADGTIVKVPAVAGLTAQSVACSLSSCPTVSELQQGWTIPEFSASRSVSFTITAAVAAGTSALTLTASATPPANVIETNPADNSVTMNATIVPMESNLQVAVTPPLATRSWTTFFYEVSVKTLGPVAGDGAIVIVPPVTGLKKLGVSCAGANGVTCPANLTIAQIEQGVTIPLLEVGPSLTFRIQAMATSSGTQTLSATVAARTGTTDPVATNNSATATVATTGVAPPGNSDVRVSMLSSVQVRTRTNAATFSFVVTVRNLGPDDAHFVVVRIPAVAGETLEGCAPSQPAAPPYPMCPVSPTISGLASGLEIPELPAGTEMRFSFQKIVPALPATATMSATANLPSGGTDPDLANNSASSSASAP